MKKNYFMNGNDVHTKIKRLNRKKNYHFIRLKNIWTETGPFADISFNNLFFIFLLFFSYFSLDIFMKKV